VWTQIEYQNKHYNIDRNDEEQETRLTLHEHDEEEEEDDDMNSMGIYDKSTKA
jgi:hypothetical protein